MTSVVSPSSRSNSALSVFVRVRPLGQTERQRGAFECVRVVNGQSLLLVDPEKFSGNALRQNRMHEREFRFEAILAPKIEEEEVQALVGTEGLVDGLVRFGRNGTVLAYGPTGTGKTYTMVGSRERPGLMNRMTRALYEQLAEMGDSETRVYISFMELYNELIRDLLSTERNGPLELFEDERGNVHVPGLSRVRASNTSRLLQLIHGGNARRTTEPTAANSTSSRSHALLMITLWRDNAEKGRLFLIDLAGSERATNTQNQGQRLKEGAAINRSLLALGNVINSLSNASDGRRPAYVNYRDSKLTRLLKDSLGGTGEDGAGRTVLIAHISPSSTAYNETFNTLTYASRAKGITRRLPQPIRRTASADRLYSDAVEMLRREAQRAGRAEGTDAIAHSSSLGILPTDGNRARRGTVAIPSRPLQDHSFLLSPSIPPLLNNSNSLPGGRSRPSNAPPANNESNAATPKVPKLPRLGTSLFDSLRDQHLANSERQQRLRERLLQANSEHYELELALKGRRAILKACEAQQTQGETENAQKCERVAERVRTEVADKERRTSELADIRHKLERALRRGEQTLQQTEERMRGLAKDQQQLQIVELVHALATQRAEREILALFNECHFIFRSILGAAIHSDFALQGKRLQKQENQLKRIKQYERIVDRLIGADKNLEGEERTKLHREYRLLRSQLDRMLPVDNGLPSWNTQILAERNAKAGPSKNEKPRLRQSESISLNGSNEELNKTFTIVRPKEWQNGGEASILPENNCGRRDIGRLGKKQAEEEGER
ncbi:hypothetical protein niasHS_007506 [Heterodera schachtii]|uniref:Kinesin-like protein n=1 Tax=Heterodera schachtii TaxID=97005 RepID=A0ABD2JXP1_HETSC